jgi:hypothetical protein
MGSVVFTVQARGFNVQEAYRKAMDDADDEMGHQEGYSGTINSSKSHRLIDRTCDFAKAKKKGFYDFAEEYASNNDEAIYFMELVKPVENKSKIKTTVEHHVEKGTKKWIQVFEISTSSGDDLLDSCATKGEALTKARTWSEKNKRKCTINIAKKLEKGSTLTATVNYKPSSKESVGLYMFYGWARE